MLRPGCRLIRARVCVCVCVCVCCARSPAQANKWVVVGGHVRHGAEGGSPPSAVSNSCCACTGPTCEHREVANDLMAAHVQTEGVTALGVEDAPPSFAGAEDPPVALRVAQRVIRTSNRKITTFAVAGGWGPPATVTVSTAPGTGGRQVAQVDWRCSHSGHTTGRPPKSSSSRACEHVVRVRELCEADLEDAETLPVTAMFGVRYAYRVRRALSFVANLRDVRGSATFDNRMQLSTRL